ncbi:carboxypeptidase-like regulatory domain-containing protein, partial [bacterium]|nr:carboxypeptidase-like regulatory domain-containing protein [bacterium]
MKAIIPLIVATACLLAGSGFLFADSTGTITGTVTDAETKEPLPGAVVILLGTTLGANTDLDGRFYVVNVPEGTYSVSAKMMGYEVKISVGVKVVPGQATTLAFQTKPKILTEANRYPPDLRPRYRQFIDAAQSGTHYWTINDKIAMMAGDDALAALALTPGVTVANGEVHVRGGRADEVAYFTDGCDVTDRMHGVYREQASLGIVEDIAVSTGGFDPAYGQAMSGIVDVRTNNGYGEYDALMKFSTDLLTGRASGHDSRYQGGCSGPLPALRGLVFSVFADIENSDDVRPCFPAGTSYVRDAGRDYVWADTVRHAHSDWIDSLGQWRHGWMDSSDAAWDAEKRRRMTNGVVRGWTTGDPPYLPHGDGNDYRLAMNLSYPFHPINAKVYLTG